MRSRVIIDVLGEACASCLRRASCRSAGSAYFARSGRACVDEAAFGYVNAFTDHVNVGFFLGALLKDPARLLEGTGKRGRHVKLRPGRVVDAAYVDIKGGSGCESIAAAEEPAAARQRRARCAPQYAPRGGPYVLDCQRVRDRIVGSRPR